MIQMMSEWEWWSTDGWMDEMDGWNVMDEMWWMKWMDGREGIQTLLRSSLLFFTSSCLQSDWGGRKVRTWGVRCQSRTVPTARTPSWWAHSDAWSRSPVDSWGSRSSWSPASLSPSHRYVFLNIWHEWIAGWYESSNQIRFRLQIPHLKVRGVILINYIHIIVCVCMIWGG